jgi:hypothetical protein
MPGLTTEGIIFMSLAWGAIISLAIFCFSKVIRSEKKKNSYN